MKVLTMNGPGGGHPEVEMTGSREDLQAVLADPNGWDDADLGEYIEESNILAKFKYQIYLVPHHTNSSSLL